LLALWGHRVQLRTWPGGDNRQLAESIPPSCGKLFDIVGVRDAMDSAGFVRTTGNTVWWGHDSARVEFFSNGARGWQVTRPDLSAVLTSTARAAGVEYIAGRATIDGNANDASFVLDCTGRHGLVARARGLRLADPALRTVALVGRWQHQTWPLPDVTHTVIESYADGWAWSVPIGTGERYVAVMVDPRTSNLSKGEGAEKTYREEIRKTRRFAPMLADASFVGGPWGWDASMYSASRYVDGNVLLVGDAGSFIDPLSSAGIKKALASAWLAAVAVHTALVRPAMRDTALGFFSAREAEIYQAFRSLTQQHLANAATGDAHPFWSDRASMTESANDVDDERATVAAFERLRAAPAVVLRRNEALTIEPRPAVSGSEIVLELRIVTADAPQGVRFVRDVDVIALLEVAPAHERVPDAFAAYCRQHGPVALPDFLAALATAVARRWLVGI
jgi:flavin-dependent dehydrogenase